MLPRNSESEREGRSALGTRLAKRSGMTALVLCALLSTAPDEVAATVAPAPRLEPVANVFTSPVSSLGMLGSGVIPGFIGWLYLPVGGTFQLGPAWGLTAELSVSASLPGSFVRDGWSFSTSAGPTFFLSGKGMDGFFITGKFSFQVGKAASRVVFFDAAPESPLDLGPGVSRSFLAGADVGYQLRFGHLTLGFLIGASAGYAYDQSDGMTTPFAFSGGFGSQRTQGSAWAMNVNFLRLGYAF